jgi:hypothetical protein
VFCVTLDLEILGPGNCRSGPSSILEETSEWYPGANNYGWYTLPNSDHCWEHQFSAQSSGFQKAHDWLTARDFDESEKIAETFASRLLDFGVWIRRAYSETSPNLNTNSCLQSCRLPGSQFF